MSGSIFFRMATQGKKNGFAETLERIRAQKRTAKRLERTTVRAGWIDGAKTLGGTEFSVIARALCYGREEGTTKSGRRYPAIPARNFVAKYGDKYAKATDREASRAISIVFRKGAEYQADLTKMLSSIGAVAVRGLKEAIVKDRYAQNAMDTVLSWARRHAGSTKAMMQANRLKGESRVEAMTAMKKELVDTGAMVQHITYAVTKK